MTIKQYQKLAKTIASKIEELSGDPNKVRNLKCNSIAIVRARDPKQYADMPSTFEKDESNIDIVFDTVSNPNNPNYKFKTLKPGSMSFYNSQMNVNFDITEYNFDTPQFADLIKMINQSDWTISK